jgi:hypothetical protein
LGDEDEDWLNIDLSGRQPKVREGAGHNSGIVARARAGLEKVALGEGNVEEGWLEYGAALNEGREMFPRGGQGDKDFGAWKVASQLAGPTWDDAAAAMWAAEDLNRYFAVKEEFPKVKTVRGLHAKFKAKERREKEAKAKKLVERQESTTSEGEKQAIQNQLDKMAKEGVNVEKVIASVKEEPPEIKTEKKKSIAYEFVDLIVNKPDLIVSCLVALARNEEDLEKLKGMLQ